MFSVTRDIRDLSPDDRSAVERLVGHPLDDRQRLVITVRPVPPAAGAPAREPAKSGLPDWCNVYQGMSDSEIAALE